MARINRLFFFLLFLFFPFFLMVCRLALAQAGAFAFRCHPHTRAGCSLECCSFE